MGSTRLPGKVLMPLAQTTVLGCVLSRLYKSRALDGVVVATSVDRDDDAIELEARRLGADVWRGSAADVLDRFAGAASAHAARTVVRVTADCPLIDAGLVDDMLHLYGDGSRFDYMSNTLVRTYPRGLDAEVFSAHALEHARNAADRGYEREHVTPYLYGHPEVFRLHAYVDPAGNDRSSMRWTLDTPQDYAFLRTVYERFPGRAPAQVAVVDVLDLLAREPSIAHVNALVRQKATVE